MPTFLYGLGKEAKDKVTGFKGVITGRSDFIAGCRQYCLTPPMKDDGTLPESKWMDEERLELTGESVDVASTKTGGPTGSERPIAR